MKVLIAFDKFKGSLSAAGACQAAIMACREAAPEFEIEEAPLTDGGEGFVELLTNAVGGEIRSMPVSGPLGKTVEAQWGLISLDKLSAGARNLLDLPAQGRLAIVEMAQASGLQLISATERDPWRASTRGTGELIREAAAAQPAAILLGIGGSATHDLGLGALTALGLRGKTEAGTQPAIDEFTLVEPQNWERLCGFSEAVQSDLPPILIASDVDNPLLGDRGAAAVFAPQKGLCPDDVVELETQTAQIAHLLCDNFGMGQEILSEAGSGAAGGIGAGFRIACGARIVSGFGLVRAWMDIDRKLEKADLIVTGEGTFDTSSLEGKGPGVLVGRAAAAGKKCLVLAGKIDLPEETKRQYSCRFYEISPRDWPLERVLAEGKTLLQDAIKQGIRDLDVDNPTT